MAIVVCLHVMLVTIDELAVEFHQAISVPELEAYRMEQVLAIYITGGFGDYCYDR